MGQFFPISLPPDQFCTLRVDKKAETDPGQVLERRQVSLPEKIGQSESTVVAEELLPPQHRDNVEGNTG